MDIEKNIQILQKGLTVDESEVKTICERAIEIFVKEDQVIRITPPVTVCGDIHLDFTCHAHQLAMSGYTHGMLTILY